MSDAMRSRQWRSHYAHTIDRLDKTGEIVERLAAVEDLELAEATWRAAIIRWPKERIILQIKRWPKERIILQSRTRVIHDSRRPPLLR